MAAQECVEGERKVQCRTVLRHGLDFALRGKDKYLGCKQIELDGVEEVHSVRLWVVEDFLDGAKPLFQFAFVLLSRAILVFPMSGKALFGNVVHAFASDLHLYPLSLVTHEGNVKCLITIRFRMVHPVAQAVGVWLVYLRQRYVDAETFAGFFFEFAWFEDDAYGQDVENFFERDMLGLHLVPDRIRRLDASQDAVLDTHLVQLGTDRSREFLEKCIAFALGFSQ